MNTTLWIQLLGIIFGLGMIYFTFVKYKRKELSKQEFVTWQSCWIILIIIAIIPSILDPIIAPLNFYRRLDFFVVIGFFVLLGLGFYNYSTMKKLERRVEILVRKEAMKNAKSEESRNEENKNTKHEEKRSEETKETEIKTGESTKKKNENPFYL